MRALFLRSLVAFSCLSVGLVGSAYGQTHLTVSEKNQLEKEGRFIVDLLQNLHYGRVTFLELKNADILDSYLETLDPEKRIFSKDDLSFIHQRFDHTLKSVYILRGDFSPAFEIMDRFKKRLTERAAWIDTFLASNPDLETELVFTESDGKANVPETESLEGWWRRSLMQHLIRDREEGLGSEEATKRVGERFRKWKERIFKMKATRVRELFTDAMVRSFDPHSGYFSTDSAEDFSTEMAAGTTGVGLRVEKKAGKCLVTKILPGSPADTESDLQVGDELLAAKVEEKPEVDAHTARIKDLNDVLTGKPDVKVMLRFKRAEKADFQEITLARKSVTLREFRAYGGVVTAQDDKGTEHRLGYLRWPEFYQSQDTTNPSSVSEDVSELVKTLKEKAVEGIVIDLRSNPGGSLPEAISLVGLFVGPSVGTVTAGADGHATPLSSEKAALYKGPLVVLTSAASASASELFSGALKYYHRALIAGETTTFGKGSVQNYIDLAQAFGKSQATENVWGTLRLTSQIFARPDGLAIQRTGTPSDLIFPKFTSEKTRHEADLPGALEARDVAFAPPTRAEEILTEKLMTELRIAAEARFETSADWQLAKESSTIRYQFFEPESFPLRLSQRAKDFEALLVREAEFAARQRTVIEGAPFRYEALQLKIVEADRERHHAAEQKRLGAALERGAPLNTWFVFKDSEGLIWDLGAEQVDWLTARADRAALAQVYNTVSGGHISPTAVSEFLTRFTREDTPDFENLFKYFEQNASLTQTDPANVRPAVAAVLRQIIKDQRLCSRTHLLENTELREAIRVLRNWNDLTMPSPAP